jgi:hypothetical protein
MRGIWVKNSRIYASFFASPYKSQAISNKKFLKKCPLTSMKVNSTDLLP